MASDELSRRQQVTDDTNKYRQATTEAAVSAARQGKQYVPEGAAPVFKGTHPMDEVMQGFRQAMSGGGKPMRFDRDGRETPAQEQLPPFAHTRALANTAFDAASGRGGLVFQPRGAQDLRALQQMSSANMMSAGRETGIKKYYDIARRREAQDAIRDIPKSEIDFTKTTPVFSQVALPNAPGHVAVRQYAKTPGGQEIPIRDVSIHTERGKIGFMGTDKRVRMSPAEAKFTLGFLDEYAKSQFGKPLSEMLANPISDTRTKYFRQLGWSGKDK